MTGHQQGKNCKKTQNTWRLNNMLLNNQWITEEIKEEIKKYLEANDNKDKTLQNLWDSAKAILKGKTDNHTIVGAFNIPITAIN